MVAPVSPKISEHRPTHCNLKADGLSPISPVKSICTFPVVRMMPTMVGCVTRTAFVVQEIEKLSRAKVTREPDPVVAERAAMRIQTLDDEPLASGPRLYVSAVAPKFVALV